MNTHGKPPEIAYELIDPQTFCDPDEHILTEFNAIAVEKYDAHARLVLTNRSIIVLPVPKLGWRDMPPPPPSMVNVPPVIQQHLQKTIWKVPHADIVQCLIVHEPRDESSKPNFADACACMIIGSKASVCGPVPYEKQSVKWKKENQTAIDYGKIGVKEIRDNYNAVIEYLCYPLPEGWFFDRSGHCLSFYLAESAIDSAERLFARIAALRIKNVDPQSEKKVPTSTDQSQNPAPWLAGDEFLKNQWQCNPPSQGIFSRFLGTPTFSLNIYLTSHRLIIKVTGNKKIEISDFPIDCVSGLTWNIGPSNGSLKVSTFGIPGLQMPTSSLLKHGYWGRELIEFDSRAPDVNNMVETLNARFNRPIPPILSPQ